MMVMFACFCMDMTFVCVSAMCPVVMAELPGRQGGNEYGKAYEHHDPLPAIMSFLVFGSFHMCPVMLMQHISVMAFCISPAFFVVMHRTSGNMYLVIYLVSNDSYDDGQDE